MFGWYILVVNVIYKSYSFKKQKTHFRRFERIIGRKVDIKEENTPLEGTIWL